MSSNEAANGIAQVSITRGTARRVHIKGRGPAVVIGRGTVSSIKRGSVMLHLRLSHGVAAKLRHLRHVTLTVTLKLVGVAHDHVVWDAAGRY